VEVGLLIKYLFISIERSIKSKAGEGNPAEIGVDKTGMSIFEAIETGNISIVFEEIFEDIINLLKYNQNYN
jgi:hypothetical protein